MTTTRPPQKTIPVAGGKVALIDAADYESLSQFRWKLHYRGYAYANGAKVTIYMHRKIMNAPAGLEVDHINGNKLDNRRANLRLATRQQNCTNTRKRPGLLSKYKGVYRHKLRWLAQIKVNQENIYLGLFLEQIDAARAYDQAAKLHFGEFARLNFE